MLKLDALAIRLSVSLIILVRMAFVLMIPYFYKPSIRFLIFVTIFIYLYMRILSYGDSGSRVMFYQNISVYCVCQY